MSGPGICLGGTGCGLYQDVLLLHWEDAIASHHDLTLASNKNTFKLLQLYRHHLLKHMQ